MNIVVFCWQFNFLELLIVVIVPQNLHTCLLEYYTGQLPFYASPF